MEFEDTPLVVAYKAFAEALGKGDTVALSRMVDQKTFRAILPGGLTQPLNWQEFIPELERRREPFSDFGKNLAFYRIMEHRGADVGVAAYYSMTVTNDGPLRAWGSEAKAPPSGRTITITCMDMVTFGIDGQIIELVTVSDRLPTLLAMGNVT